MIGRIFTIATATAVTAIAVAAAVFLVALDLLGTPLLERAWSYLTTPGRGRQSRIGWQLPRT